MEFNSHIYEATHKDGQEQSITELLNVIDRLGQPEEVLKTTVAEKQLKAAVKSFNPVKLLKALLLNLGNGISYILFFIIFVLLFAFVFVIIAKIMNPDEVGMFYKKGEMLMLGSTTRMGDEGVHELLGNWFIPVVLLLTGAFYYGLTLLIKLKQSFKKSILK